MLRCCFVLLFVLPVGCAESVVQSPDAAGDAGCVSWARPTGTCTAPRVCCVSSTCVSGICR